MKASATISAWTWAAAASWSTNGACTGPSCRPRTCCWRISTARSWKARGRWSRPPYATALTIVEGGRLEPCEQKAIRLCKTIVYDDDYQGLALDNAEGDRMAAKLGDKRILFLAHHGIIVTHRSVAEAYDDLYYLERACQVQVIARQTGLPLRPIPEPVLQRTEAQYGDERTSAPLHFASLKRILDREEPDYAN
jgi:hypothetical protein